MRDAVVVVFARAPEPGRVKTRLARAVGDERACELYRWLGARVVGGLTGDDARPYDVAVHHTPAEGEGAVRRWLPGADAYAPQPEGDLGARLAHAVEGAFAEGRRAVVLVGTDCAAVTGARVREALAALDGRDAALGPAADGGYYLLALARALPVFEGVPWSTGAVAAVTRERLAAAGASWRELATERDVDEAGDLAALRGMEGLPAWAEELMPMA